MKPAFSISVCAAFALVACTAQHAQDPQPGAVDTCDSCGGGGDGGSGSGSGSSGGSGSASGSGSGGDTAAACPLGAAAFTSTLGAADLQERLGLAVDASGNVAVAGSGQVSGFTELSGAGSVLASLPFGSQVAFDAQGHLFIAGGFSSPIDLGNGQMLVPHDNIDAFLVELDAKRDVILAKDLGVCGDGVSALAIAKDGRIAVSGTAMGTVVLDADGDLLFQLAAGGHIAFAADGSLAIAGVDANAQALLTVVDRLGASLFADTFTGSATITGVAIDAKGNIVVVGNTDSEIDVFGTRITADIEDQVLSSGAFAFEVDAAGNVQFVTPLYIAFVNAVAIGGDGLAYFAATTQGFNGPEVATSGQIGRIDSEITVNHPDFSITYFGVGVLFRGNYSAIAIDRCGSIVLGGVGYQAQPPNNAVVIKLSGL